jgi:ADP-ribose pyrophosphatase YjhB (NUDIX family)
MNGGIERMKFCSNCGNPIAYAVPPGDDRARFLCEACGAIHYQNPRVVAGCIPEYENRVLLCRRAIEPAYGKWTLPAGYLENGETVAACAARETREEAGAQIEGLTPYLLYNICHINQIYLIFRGRLKNLGWAAGKESLEVKLYSETDIPWDQIAFRVIAEALKTYFRDRPDGLFPFSIRDIAPPPGPAFPERPRMV